jgi:hypothetical protein
MTTPRSPRCPWHRPETRNPRVRREALRRIPDAGGRNSEERSWGTWLARMGNLRWTGLRRRASCAGDHRAAFSAAACGIRLPDGLDTAPGADPDDVADAVVKASPRLIVVPARSGGSTARCRAWESTGLRCPGRFDPGLTDEQPARDDLLFTAVVAMLTGSAGTNMASIGSFVGGWSRPMARHRWPGRSNTDGRSAGARPPRVDTRITRSALLPAAGRDRQWAEGAGRARSPSRLRILSAAAGGRAEWRHRVSEGGMETAEGRAHGPGACMSAALRAGIGPIESRRWHAGPPGVRGGAGQVTACVNPARPLITAGHGHSVAVRARSRTPAVEPTYMSSVMR